MSSKGKQHCSALIKKDLAATHKLPTNENNENKKQLE